MSLREPPKTGTRHKKTTLIALLRTAKTSIIFTITTPLATRKIEITQPKTTNMLNQSQEPSHQKRKRDPVVLQGEEARIQEKEKRMLKPIGGQGTKVY